MLNAIIGKKKKMSQAFSDEGRIPVTKIIAGPCIVTEIKTPEKDNYWAVQLGFGTKRIKNVSKPLQGHLKGAIKKNKKAPRFLREVRLDKKPDVKVGDEVKLSDMFGIGDTVQITSTSKGKGFAGVVKRWGFAGGPRTHGQSDRLRAPGSIGQGTDPGRVRKGKKMPGRMGTETVTVKNLKVVNLDEEKNEIEVSGPVPGHFNSLLTIKHISKSKQAANVNKKTSDQSQGKDIESNEKVKETKKESDNKNKEVK